MEAVDSSWASVIMQKNMGSRNPELRGLKTQCTDENWRFSYWLFNDVVELFPKLKSRVKVWHFQTIHSVQTTVTDAVKTLIKLNFNPAMRRGKIVGPIVLH
jgi:hypothetical protein